MSLVQHDSSPLNRVQRRFAQVQLRTLVGFITFIVVPFHLVMLALAASSGCLTLRHSPSQAIPTLRRLGTALGSLGLSLLALRSIRFFGRIADRLRSLQLRREAAQALALVHGLPLATGLHMRDSLVLRRSRWACAEQQRPLLSRRAPRLRSLGFGLGGHGRHELHGQRRLLGRSLCHAGDREVHETIHELGLAARGIQAFLRAEVGQLLLVKEVKSFTAEAVLARLGLGRGR
mmetsp:Transcript_94321/g.224638  ORF Transcript_94321/g.224638 Transcript_94321/m.224638 type:complete len:233 (+) Transcript_94321:1699-2397(+)